MWWQSLLINVGVALARMAFREYVAPKISPAAAKFAGVAADAIKAEIDGPNKTTEQDKLLADFVADIIEPSAKAKAKLAAADPGS